MRLTEQGTTYFYTSIDNSLFLFLFLNNYLVMKKLFTLLIFALLAITSAWATDYSLVTSASDLAAGDVIVIASSSNLMSTTQNTNNRSATTSGFTFSADKKTVTVTGSNVEVITLEAGTTTGTFAFKVTKGYLYAGSTSKNALKTQSTKNDNASATVEINSSTGVASVIFNKGSSTLHNVLQYNTSNNGIYGCYLSSSPQEDVYIYKAASSGKTATTLSFGSDWDGKEITKYIGEDIFNCPATLTPAVEGATITYSSSDKNVATIDNNGDILLGDAEGKTTITANYAGNDNYEASSASFTINLKELPDPTISHASGEVEAGTEVTITAPAIDGATIEVSYEPEGEATVDVKDVTTTTITITKPTYLIANTVYNGVKSAGIEANYTIKAALSSIAISGEPKKEYNTGDKFSTDGLTVTATYSDGSTADVTSDVTWSSNPATFDTEGKQNVTVTATYNGKTATENYTVTVTAPSVSTNTYTLVTSTNELVSGAQYVLLTSDGARAASDWNGSDKITTVAAGDNTFELNDKVVTTKGTSVNVLTIAASDTKWTITDQNGVKYASSKKSTDITNDNGTVAISFDTDGAVTIVGYSGRQWLYQEKSSGNTTQTIGNYSATNKTGVDYCTLKLYKSNAQVVVKPAVPTFDPVSGTTFTDESATVTITAAEGCTLKYTLGDGVEQTVDNNTADVTVTPTAYTIKAKSVNAEGVESVEATATYKFDVIAHVKNIAEFMALEENTTAIFDNPVIVLYDYSQPSTKIDETTGKYSNPEYIWVKDETGHTNIYFEVAIDSTNHQAKYENGDVIPAGFVAVKSYYPTGKYIQAKVEIENNETFEDAKLKRLADPVTITFDEFNALQVGSDADIAKWNNTYVMISKVTMAADETDKRGKTYNVSHNGVAATNNVFYNKYSDLRDGKYALTKQGEDARVTMPTSSTIEYNVYGILQRFNEYWEIMPIRFVEYSEATVTLKELVEAGNAGTTTEGTEYTILNDLRGVVALPNNVILAKDENGNAVGKVTPAGKSFVITAKSYFSDDTTESVNAKAQEDYDQSNWVEIVLPTGVSASDYVDKIITGLSVKGQYKNTLNPRLEASVAPTPGGETGAYTRNAMCPANFMGTSQACNSEEHHGDYFFMTPKPNECVQVVWAVYNITDGNFYIPAKEGSINTHAFKGGFDIDWTYNAGGVIDGLQDGGLYQFKAVVKKQEKAEPQSGKRRIDYYNTELSTDYLVYPLNLDGNYVTGITEAAGAKTVKSVRYFNIMGVELAEPAAGVNIVLTTYTDGTTHSQKILK